MSEEYDNQDQDNVPIVFDAVAEHDATAIIIHGLGDSAETWAVPVEEWRRNGNLDNVKFVLPNAPTRNITAVSNTPFTPPSSW